MYYITVSNGLLTGEHRKNMGSSVWEFMWCIDKVTKIDEDGTGYVLGGKPIKLSDLAIQMGTSEKTASRNLTHLQDKGYLEMLRTPYGTVITVHKTKKIFNKRDNYVRSPDNYVQSQDKSVRSNKIEQLDKTDDRYTPLKFFEEVTTVSGKYLEKIESLAEIDYLSKNKLHAIVTDEFVPHWREKSSEGGKESWQKQRSFDVMKRLDTWVRNTHKWQKDYKCKAGKWHRKGDTCHCGSKKVSGMFKIVDGRAIQITR